MSMYAISDKTMPLHLIFWGSLLGWAAVTWRGSSTQVHAASQEKDLTLKFHQASVARWCFCHMTYSYPNCKVLYEDYLISSHIFIPDTPQLLDPSFTSRGKHKAWMRCRGFKQSLGGWSEKLTQLKHSFTVRGSISPYLHSLVVTYCFKHLQSKEKPNQIRAQKLNYELLSRGQKRGLQMLINHKYCDALVNSLDRSMSTKYIHTNANIWFCFSTYPVKHYFWSNNTLYIVPIYSK